MAEFNERLFAPAKKVDLVNASRGLRAEETNDWRYLSAGTVRNYRSKIIHALKARNMSHAVRIGFEIGILEAQLYTGPENPITPHQAEILDLVSQGYESDEIADVLPFTHKTVYNNRSFILRRLSARTMPHAVRLGVESGIIAIEGLVLPTEAAKELGTTAIAETVQPVINS